jgi:hypothetical protein
MHCLKQEACYCAYNAVHSYDTNPCLCYSYLYRVDITSSLCVRKIRHNGNGNSNQLTIITKLGPKRS